MAKKIMIQGTMSNVGKSLIVAALCRIFRNDGYKVAPFKSQNMALNSYITKAGDEIGRAQAMQAMAAGTEPVAAMNPILLKPTTDVGSQVIVNGKPIGNMRASEYFAYKKTLIPDIMKAYKQLDETNDIVVIEGAGSPAEINLKENDIVNMGLARMLDAPVLLVGDIDRGGVFAQLYGTIALLEEEERNRIKGILVNKFRGDVSLLTPGFDMMREHLKPYGEFPFVGVVPYTDADIEEEDSQSLRLEGKNTAYADGVAAVDIAVIRLPKMSNYTDIAPFEAMSDVSVRYVRSVGELRNPDIIIIPGTKSTITDMEWLRQCGLEAAVKRQASKGVTVWGICGGMQILGNTIRDICGVECGGQIQGMELLDIDTVFLEEKVRRQCAGVIEGLTGRMSGLNGCSYEGYEIHMGRSEGVSGVIGKGNVYGTYIHGIFDKTADYIVDQIAADKGITRNASQRMDYDAYRDMQYEKLADCVRKGVDIDRIREIMSL